MALPEHDLPNWVQWAGLWSTVVSAVFGFLGLIASVFAAVKAKGAKEQAAAAREAAVRAARVAELADLISEMQELQIMLARTDFAAIAAKCSHLRGRIARFKNQAYTELGENERAHLDVAREQMQILGRIAAVGKAKDETRTGQIQVAYGVANEALNSAVAIHATSNPGRKQ
jgi:hypothetical protein